MSIRKDEMFVDCTPYQHLWETKQMFRVRMMQAAAAHGQTLSDFLFASRTPPPCCDSARGDAPTG